MKSFKEILSAIQPVFQEAQKYNRVALGITAVILMLLPFVLVGLIGFGVDLGPQTPEAIRMIYNAGIAFAGTVMMLAVVLFAFDVLTNHSSENVGKAVKQFLLVATVLFWVLAAWAIANFALDKAGVTVGISKQPFSVYQR